VFGGLELVYAVAPLSAGLPVWAPVYRTHLGSGAGRAWPSAHDRASEVRVVELAGHPCFVATLFQPERSGLRGIEHPLV